MEVPVDRVEVYGSSGEKRGRVLTIARPVSLRTRADVLGKGLGDSVVGHGDGALVRLVWNVCSRLWIDLLHVHHRVPVCLLIPLQQKQTSCTARAAQNIELIKI